MPRKIVDLIRSPAFGRRKDLLSEANMEVTKENFEEILLGLPDVFEKALFIAFDTEFTGLKVEGASSLNYFDTLEDLYLKDRLKAETFMAIQIGLVAFFYDEETKTYSHIAYNFYVYPSTYSDVNFTCQSNSIQFLIQHGFDFNKLFKTGIPYLKESEVSKLLEKLTEKYEKKSSLSSGTKIEIPNEHKGIINKITNRIKEILDLNDKSSFTTDRYNSYIRRLIWNSVQQQFGSTVLVDTNNDESMTIMVGFSDSEIKERQREKFLLQKKEILDEVGFCKVIKLMIESKVLLVGHNLFLDILFVIRQFLVPLPDSYSEFKELLRFLLPSIMDTKYMAASEIKNIKDTSLHTLVEYFENLEGFPEVSMRRNGIGYTLKDKQLHNASYDAYLTGMCFLAMTKHLGIINLTSNITKNLQKSPILQSVLNKLSIPKLCDIFCMNIGGLDNMPDRTGVYHLTFPREWTRENIMDVFKNCGFIHISWINSTSAFVKVKKEYIVEVEKNLMGENEDFKLQTHSQFKSSNSNHAELLLSPLMEKRLGSDVKGSQDNDSPMKVNSSGSGKKRKVEEDIGVVLERPQKKLCS